ncbi:MAG: GNAT family N-acetyltransferase [Pirellulales bacterium]|nr:GNAT family N-acetyltransferase [Pirellulales bacterium]
MGLTYFKRFRMEIDLAQHLLRAGPLPLGYRLVPWHAATIEAHAEAKYHSFRHELDANVFPCLGDPEGCYRLMLEISRKEGFLPGATWLLEYRPQARSARPTSHPPPGPSEPEMPVASGMPARGCATNGQPAVEYCGTIQGICDRSGVGAIQNFGVTPEHRGRGLGTQLMAASLAGFARSGIRRVYLEVTAQNEAAIRLYTRLGFVKVRTIYKAVELGALSLFG